MKQSIVELAMRYRTIVILITCFLLAFGAYGLYDIQKNEFPNFTVRQGIVAAVYPGATAEEVEEQVTKPLEEYIFTYKEVKKAKTKSYSKNGMVYMIVELNDDINMVEKEDFWNRFKHGVQDFKMNLPSGVLAVVVKDDFGDTSSLLVTMESEDKTYRELDAYMEELQDRLRAIESVGRLTVTGGLEEQIAIYFDAQKMSQYGINYELISAKLLLNGFTTSSGTLRNNDYSAPIYVARSLNSVGDIEQTIIYSSPTGNVVRVGDIAKVVREYPQNSSYITNNGRRCILLSVEIKKDRSITDMGAAVQAEIADFQKTLPEDVTLFTITNQPKVVSDSVASFLKELLIAVAAVIIVVIILMPIRVALVAASTIPISIFISLGLFYAFGIELNTVTLAALIVTLGMIVDNSIVIIDSYVEMLAEGKDRWNAAIESAQHFFKPVLTATLAISITFFPLLITTKGNINDFLGYFPWAILIVLGISLLVAMLIVPFMEYYVISAPKKEEVDNAKNKPSFIDKLQSFYDKVVDWCFAHMGAVMCFAILSVVIGVILFTKLPQKTMPIADRNQFAVEITLPTGASLAQTVAVADSLERILRQEPEIVSIASFHGCASPRFHSTYAPQMAGSNYAQFIVNTTSNQATVELLDKYAEAYHDYFPEAFVRFKQMSFVSDEYPFEIRLTGTDWQQLKFVADSIKDLLRTDNRLILLQSDNKQPQTITRIQLDNAKASRLGINNVSIELALMNRYNESGMSITSVWEGSHETKIIAKGSKADNATVNNLEDEPIPVAGGLRTVPLRQVATVTTEWEDGQIGHRNGVPTISIVADIVRGENLVKIVKEYQSKLGQEQMPDGVTFTWGGEYESSNETTMQVVTGIIIAIAIIFFLVLAHFGRIRKAVLLLGSLVLVVFGTAMGVLIGGVDFSLTCYLGVISLMGILVRNAIIMYDYAEELEEGGMNVKEAIMTSAKRRMRPIFLTSAAASMGVIPMILGGSGLWMPMGSVICYGTILTMVLILTVLPVAYYLMMAGADKIYVNTLVTEYVVRHRRRIRAIKRRWERK